MHGANVSVNEIVDKAGVCWDGGPGMNKWYEALEHYNIEVPEGAFDRINAAEARRWGSA